MNETHIEPRTINDFPQLEEIDGWKNSSLLTDMLKRISKWLGSMGNIYLVYIYTSQKNKFDDLALNSIPKS